MVRDQTWTCHICGESRPDACIAVFSVDTSEDFDLPRGTMRQNVRYCNDRRDCMGAAPMYRHARRQPGA